MRPLAANIAGVRFNRTREEAAPFKDARVGIVHRLIGGIRGFERGVETVGVLHDEFLGAHQSETRANLIAEFGLDLIDRAGQLAVGVDFAAHQFGDNLFVRRTECHEPLRAVTQLEHARPHGGESSGFFPQFSRLERGHQNFLGACAIHLFTYDLGDLLQRAHAEGHKGVKSAGELADQACAHHQFMAGDFCFLRVITQGCDERTGPTHIQNSFLT